MEWMKKHVDTVVILGSVVGAMSWMNMKFNEIDNRFNEIEKELAIIKTVLIMKDIMPMELAKNDEDVGR